MSTLNIAGDFYVNPKFLDKFTNEKIDAKLIDLFEKADYNIVNLEAPIIRKKTPIPKTGPNLGMSKRGLKVLKSLNIDAVSLANNHILDHGAEGLNNTFQSLKENNIQFFGAGENYEEASRAFIKLIDGMKIGILNMAENEWSNTHGKMPGASPLDIMDNTRAVQQLKPKVDHLLVIVHGGSELHRYPTPRFKKMLRYFVDQGADAVIGHHTHCYNGFEYYRHKPILFSTGNFIFPRQNAGPDWTTGVIASLRLKKNQNIELQTLPISLNVEAAKTLSLLEGKAFDEFRAEEKRKNKIIADDQKLEEVYDAFFEKAKKQYIHYLQPFSSRYLHKVFSLGIIPDFLKTPRKKRLYLNLIRCESHRDMLLKLLK